MKLRQLTLALLVLAVGQLTLHGASACGSGGGGSGSRGKPDDAEVDVPDRSESQEAGKADRNIRVSGRIRLSPAPASLPANARLVVSLQDISLADAPSKLLNRQTVSSVSAAYDADRSIPYSIEATLPTSTPVNAYSVSVSAGLSGDGVSYITDTNYYVDLKPNTFEYNSLDFTIVKYP